MKIVAAESTFDGNRITISFFAEERVDFRELVSRAERPARSGASSSSRSRPATRRAWSAATAPAAGASAARLRRRPGAGLDPHGQRPEPAAQPVQDLRLLRPPDVLPQVRARGLHVVQEARAQEGQRSSRRRRAKERSSSCSPRPTASSVDLGEGRVVTCRLAELATTRPTRRTHERPRHVVLNVPDVSCEHCKMAIESAVCAARGRRARRGRRRRQERRRRLRRRRADLDAVKDAIEDEGYPVAGEHEFAPDRRAPRRGRGDDLRGAGTITHRARGPLA